MFASCHIRESWGVTCAFDTAMLLCPVRIRVRVKTHILICVQHHSSYQYQLVRHATHPPILTTSEPQALLGIKTNKMFFSIRQQILKNIQYRQAHLNVAPYECLRTYNSPLKTQFDLNRYKKLSLPHLVILKS